MKPMTRRNALILGGLGTASLVAGGTGLVWSANSGFVPSTTQDLTEPRALHSVAGALKVRLTAAEGRTLIAGHGATALTYNGGAARPHTGGAPRGSGERVPGEPDDGTDQPPCSRATRFPER